MKKKKYTLLFLIWSCSYYYRWRIVYIKFILSDKITAVYNVFVQLELMSFISKKLYDSQIQDPIDDFFLFFNVDH